MTKKFDLPEDDAEASAEFLERLRSLPPDRPRLTPVVVIGVGGGLVQWEVAVAGTGKPEVFVLDFDREGAEPEELTELAGYIDEAIVAIESRTGDEAVAVANMREAAEEYRQMVKDGDSPGRYR